MSLNETTTIGRLLTLGWPSQFSCFIFISIIWALKTRHRIQSILIKILQINATSSIAAVHRRRSMLSVLAHRPNFSILFFYSTFIWIHTNCPQNVPLIIRSEQLEYSQKFPYLIRLIIWIDEREWSTFCGRTLPLGSLSIWWSNARHI